MPGKSEDRSDTIFLELFGGLPWLLVAADVGDWTSPLLLVVGEETALRGDSTSLFEADELPRNLAVDGGAVTSRDDNGGAATVSFRTIRVGIVLLIQR